VIATNRADEPSKSRISSAGDPLSKTRFVNRIVNGFAVDVTTGVGVGGTTTVLVAGGATEVDGGVSEVDGGVSEVDGGSSC